MQVVMAFTRRRAEAAQTSASGSGASGGGYSGGYSGGKTLGGMSRGVSVLGSIMEFAGGLQKATAIAQEGRDEQKQARAEFISSVERTNAIDAEYNRLVGEQRAATSAMGIDVSSGSVTAARDAARDEAARERRIITNSADANAALRRLRAVRLNDAAKNQKLGSFLKLGLDVAGAFVGG